MKDTISSGSILTLTGSGTFQEQIQEGIPTVLPQQKKFETEIKTINALVDKF